MLIEVVLEKVTGLVPFQMRLCAQLIIISEE